MAHNGIPKVAIAFGLVMLLTAARPSVTTVQCDDPRGFQVLHGKDRLGKPGYHREDVTDKFGSHPLFLIDSADPSFITVIWGGTESVGKKFTEKHSSASAKKARVVFRSEHQVSAVEGYLGGVYVYTLFPRMGYGVFTKQGHWADGQTATAWIYFGSCTFKEN